LVGPAFLVTPVIDEIVQEVVGYFPANIWYRYSDGQIEHDDENKGKNMTLKAGYDFIPLHVRGGFILPTQDPANTTEFSRRNPFGLIVAPNEENEAKGDLFYDDGSSNLEKNSYFYATFFLRDNVLKMNIEHNTFRTEMRSKKLNTIRIFMKNPDRNLKFYLNGDNQPYFGNKVFFEDRQVILKNLSLSMDQPLTLKWTVEDLRNEETILDCSLQNKALSESECEKRGCEFDSNSIEPVPRCFIPTRVGGYMISSSFQDNYSLKKINDSLSLFGEDVQELSVEVFHGKIKNPDTQNKPINPKDPGRLTNIKVKYF
jgi:maltase-glucoamylase